jgi:hypothetical protein
MDTNSASRQGGLLLLQHRQALARHQAMAEHFAQRCQWCGSQARHMDMGNNFDAAAP